jgi:hypothetical protein
MNIAAKSPNRAAIGDARGGLGPNSSELRSSSTTVSIEEVEVGAADSGGRNQVRHSLITPQMMRPPAFPAGSLV